MKCNVCEVGCEIDKFSRGRCGTYVCTGDSITQYPEMGYLGAYPISIETVPLLHFYPSGKFMQVFSTGCNLQCSGCMTRMLTSGKPNNYFSLNPSQVVEKALQEECLGIVSTLNEPVANYFLFRDLCVQAKEKGLLAGCSTNCYFTGETLEELGQFLDFVNVGIKGFSDISYISCGAPSAAPVFRNISRLYEMGVHIETSVVYSKGNEKDLIKVSEAVSNVSPNIPMHVMRFLPLGYSPIELEPSVGEAEKLCVSLHKYLNYVYLFNSPGTELLNTYCPECNSLLTEREFHGYMGSRLVRPWENYACNCGNNIPVKGKTGSGSFSKTSLLDGYRRSRVFSMVHSVLICLGVLEDCKLMGVLGGNKLMDVWEKVSDVETLKQINNLIRQPYSYLEFIKLIAEKANLQKKGEELVSFIHRRLKIVQDLAAESSSYKVYYCMGSPLFALNAGRMENNLVTFSGGISINKQLQKEGRPGVNVSPDYINENNPEIIFISGLLSRPLDEFYGLCHQYGIHAKALTQKRIYEVPPAWDFGSPRWILGLMYIADKLHPGKLRINLLSEADEFYMQFYGMHFKEARPNRSFHRPSSGIWPRNMTASSRGSFTSQTYTLPSYYI